MQTYKQIQFQVGAWNIENFGNQETPYLNAVFLNDDPTLQYRVELGSLAPLMGMVEELGELFEARNNADIRDAIGDISIYLCDYCCRERLVFPTRVVLEEKEQRPGSQGLVVNLGRLYHCHLKRHQGIRGMSDDTKFNEARMAALRALVWHLEVAARTAESNLVVILNETWNKVVKKRNWVRDPVTGGGHAHEVEV